MVELFETFLDATRYLNIEQKDYSTRTVAEAALEQLRRRGAYMGVASQILEVTAYLGTDAKDLLELTRDELGIDEVRRLARHWLERHGQGRSNALGYALIEDLYYRANVRPAVNIKSDQVA